MSILTKKTSIRVRYADTDKMGVVYYSNYAVFYEVGRTEMFRSLGIPYSLLEEQGVSLPVIELVSHYHRSARYDDLITVESSIESLPTVKIKINYRILSEDGALLNDGSTTLVFVDMKTGRPVRCPQSVLDTLKKASDGEADN